MLLASITAWGLGALGLILVYTVITWNRFVRHGNRVKEAASGVDVQLQRRSDLVPNLVAVVKGYAAHEKDTLEAVVKARGEATARGSSARDPKALAARAEPEGHLAKALSRLFLLVEAYPELRADKNFRRLHDDLVQIEDDLQYARRYYNGTVRDHNIAVERFPALLVALFLGCKAQPFFQADGEALRSVPTIDFPDADDEGSA